MSRIIHHAGSPYAGESREFLDLPPLYAPDPTPARVKLLWAIIGAVVALIGRMLL